MMPETLIDLMRHGEPEGGRAYRGHGVDDPLSDTGWQQMWSAVGDHSPWQQIISSPMRRCRAFAEALSARHGLPVAIDERLKEIGFGVWEGKTVTEVQQNDREAYESFYLDPVNARPQGAEPLDRFMRRVTEAYDGILGAHTGKHCLVVAHAGVIRAIITTTLQAEPASMYRIRVANGALTRIRHTRHGARLEFLNTILGNDEC
jgi:probable phosphoglycerate mutase